MATHPAEKHLWWQTGVIYQVYPLSFMDSNGDGYGDLPGILNKLDHLKGLGVDAVWISPVYPSPLADCGYDVSDHTGIHPLFGTMGDFDRLLAGCHERGLKLILDFVPNHTSDQHPWFIESRSSRENPRRDWYIWEDAGRDRVPPNNWLSVFGGSAWEWDEATGQYYLHSFLREQPDLNWRNPEVQGAMLNVIRFWLDKGVDGFRVDALWHVMKDEHLRDNPLDPDYIKGESLPCERFIAAYSGGQPEIHDVVGLMRRVVDEYDERLLIGEMYLPIRELMGYYGREQDTGLHLPYNFQLITLPWKAVDIFAGVTRYEASLPAFAWPNWVLGNHDKPRIASRVAPEQARVAAMLLLTLRGTPTIYYGEEIGMRNVPAPPERARDPVGWLLDCGRHSRDPERSPMQWDAGPNGGFTAGEPWLPVADDAGQVNVEAQERDEGSMLAFYRRLLKLRGAEPALQIGRYEPAGQKGSLFAFLRDDDKTCFLIAVNLGGTRGRLAIPKHLNVTGEVVFGTDPPRVGKQISEYVALDPNEGLIARIRPRTL